MLSVIEVSDPEWGPFWLNYKALKKKLKVIKLSHGFQAQRSLQDRTPTPNILWKSTNEVEFFRYLQKELEKTNAFFNTTEQIYRLRHEVISEGFARLRDEHDRYDKSWWSRLLRATVKFYKDILLLVGINIPYLFPHI